MKILIIAARLPLPLVTGAKIRAFHLIRTLAKRHQTTLISYVGNGGEKCHVKELEAVGVRVIPVINPALDKPIGIADILRNVPKTLPVTIDKYNTDPMRSAILKELESPYDVLHFEHLHIAHYLIDTVGIRKVLDAHNVEQQIAHRVAESENNFAKRIVYNWNYRKLKNYEDHVCNKVDLILSVSDNDREVFRRNGVNSTMKLLENGVDVDYFTPRTEGRQDRLVFVGSMDWLPNADAVQYFAKDIFPKLRAHLPEVRFTIVGKDPSRDLMKLAQGTAGLHVTGTVDDVRPYIEEATVYVVPIRFGGGTRLKVLEAFSMGKPVVSTSLGCEGIACEDGKHLVIADNPVNFADSVLQLLKDERYRRELGNNAQKLARKQYSWQTIGDKLLQYYEEL